MVCWFSGFPPPLYYKSCLRSQLAAACCFSVGGITFFSHSCGRQGACRAPLVAGSLAAPGGGGPPAPFSSPVASKLPSAPRGVVAVRAVEARATDGVVGTFCPTAVAGTAITIVIVIATVKEIEIVTVIEIVIEIQIVIEIVTVRVML